MNTENKFVLFGLLFRFHVSSTYGAEIDYWISGEDAELLHPLNVPSSNPFPIPNFSEKLFLVPGLGETKFKPLYLPTYTRPSGAESLRLLRENPEQPFVIIVPWSRLKVSSILLEALELISTSSRRPIVFHWLTGQGSGTILNSVSILTEIERRLGVGKFRIGPEVKDREYLEQFLQGHIMIDSHPCKRPYRKMVHLQQLTSIMRG